jgi:hypothetical protein
MTRYGRSRSNRNRKLAVPEYETCDRPLQQFIKKTTLKSLENVPMSHVLDRIQVV